LSARRARQAALYGGAAPREHTFGGQADAQFAACSSHAEGLVAHCARAASHRSLHAARRGGS
jgi:hypothetical protein